MLSLAYIRTLAGALALLAGSGIALAQNPAPQASDPVPLKEYAAVNGKKSCPADSNAMKINQGLSLGGPDVWSKTCINCVTHALFVTDPSVVGELTNGGKPEAPKDASWTFQHIMAEIGGWRGGGGAIRDVFGSIIRPETINGFFVEPRADVRTKVVDVWLKRVGAGNIDDLASRLNEPGESNAAWNAAPFKLIAIGYRPDLVRGPFEQEGRITGGGEGRFVFQALDENNNFLAFTLIFEYALPAASLEELQSWAIKYDALRKLPFGANYNAELAKITKAFTDRDVTRAVPNNITLGQLRTNELVQVGTGFEWELREFRISHRGMLEPAAVQMNPDLTFNTAAKSTLLRYLNGAEFKGKFPNTSIPWMFENAPFLAATAITPAAFVGPGDQTGNKLDTWLAGEPNLDEALRHNFASSTCNGCHGGDAIRSPTGRPDEDAILARRGFFRTGFTHIDARGSRGGHFEAKDATSSARSEAVMSDFMCSADLPERVQAMKLFLEASSTVRAALSARPAESIRQLNVPAAQQRQIEAGAQVVRKNLYRTH